MQGYMTRKNRIHVIDATKTMTIVHQNHDYSHHPLGINGVHKGPEYEWILEVAGGPFRMFTLDDADWVLDSDGPNRPVSDKRGLWRRFSRFPCDHSRRQICPMALRTL